MVGSAEILNQDMDTRCLVSLFQFLIKLLFLVAFSGIFSVLVAY